MVCFELISSFYCYAQAGTGIAELIALEMSQQVFFFFLNYELFIQLLYFFKKN